MSKGILVDNVTVRFGEKIVYQDLSLEINENEFVCVLGKSGCGKSVLLNTILGNIKPNAGKIYLDGKNVKQPSRIVGVAYQDFFILPWLTIRENLELATKNSVLIAEFSSMMKIDKFLDLLPKEVSIGTKQRASIARSFCVQSKFLLMDEPLCSVDAITASQIREDLKIACKNRTVLYITHDINEALSISTRIICLGENGKIVLDQPTIKTSKRQILNALSKF